MIYKLLVLICCLLSLSSAASNNFKTRAGLEEDEEDMNKRQMVLVKNPIIFGLDMLGWGVDIRTAPPGEGSLRVPLYTWAFTQGSTYLYPLEPETTFQVPDEVFVRTVAQMMGTNRIYTKTDQYLTDLTIGLGISIQKAAQNNAQASGNSATNTSGSLSSTDLSGFSGSVGVTYNMRKLNSDEYLLVQNSLESDLWQLVVGPDIAVRDELQNDINTILNIADANDRYLATAEFIDRVGTHFIDSVIVGGNLVTESITETSNSLSTQELAILANFGFNNMFGLSEGSVSLNLTFVDSYSTFEQDTTNTINVLGGDPELANFFRGDVEPSETFVNWAQTLIRNPAVVRPRCREISWIWPGTDLQEISQVVNDYMTGKTPF